MFQGPKRPLVLAGGEALLIAGAVVAASYLRLGVPASSVLLHPDGLVRILLIVLVCQVCLHYADLYELRGTRDFREVLVRLFQAIGAAAIVLAVLYFWFPDWIIGRGVFLFSAGLAIVVIVLWRISFAWLTSHMAPRERLLLVGTSAAAIELARELYDRRQELGVEIVGFVDVDPARVGQPVLNPGVVGTVDDIPALVTRFAADRVVVSLSDARGRLPMDRLLDIRMNSGVTFDHLASVYEEYTGKIAVENLRPSWLIFSRGFRKTKVVLAAKRASDVLAAVVGFILALPIMAVTAVIVWVTSPGPILYHQERVGLNGRIFRIHKFRTMHVDAEALSGPVWSAHGDTRVTAIGRLLRRTRLDELPQLWNVLRGEMSFVGPRPERPEFVAQLTAGLPFYPQRHVVKPGITGWAQVRYTYGASVEDAMQKLQYDLYYIKNVSLAFDLVVVLETIKIVVLGRGGR